MPRISLLLAILFAVVFVVPASAATPQKLAQQGRLLGVDGAPLDGTLPMEFALYDAPEGGDPVWSEIHDVIFDDGYYSVLLGATSPLDEIVFDGSTLWMELVLDGDILSPRQEVVSVPYAERAATAASVETATLGDLACLDGEIARFDDCLLYTSPSPRDATLSRMPSSA